MKKVSLFLLGMSVSFNNAYAQDAVLSLTGDDVVSISAAEEQAAKEQAAKEASASSTEDKGIFSFLNFWKKDNKPQLPDTSTSPEETLLQKLERMANSGDLNSQLTLGYMYLYGDDTAKVEQDYKQAFKYYEMAANQNDNVAVNNLGSLYYSGIGTPRDIIKATQMFSKAAELGNTEAMVNLAFIYISEEGDFYRPNEAIELFRRASSTQNPTADFMLGYAYYKGFVVEKNNLEAFELVRRAANAGYDEAMYVLSGMYMNGEGTPQNYGNGVKVLDLAVKQGNVPSMMELGYILANGEKYPKNIYKAHILFNVASVRGAEGAAERREILRKGMKIEELLQAQAAAEAYKEKPSTLTQYIRQTFGSNVRQYIDKGMEKQLSKKNNKKSPQN